MKKKNLIASMVILSFIFMVVSSMFLLNQVKQARQIDPLEMESLTKEGIISYIYSHQTQNNLPLVYFLPVFGFFGALVGASTYFILSSDLEKKSQTIKFNSSLILNLLSHDERKVVAKMAKSGGRIHQLEITYMEGFTKVKAHRIVESLVLKGILEKEKMGKARLILMKKDFLNLLNE